MTEERTLLQNISWPLRRCAYDQAIAHHDAVDVFVENPDEKTSTKVKVLCALARAYIGREKSGEKVPEAHIDLVTGTLCKRALDLVETLPESTSEEKKEKAEMLCIVARARNESAQGADTDTAMLLYDRAMLIGGEKERRTASIGKAEVYETKGLYEKARELFNALMRPALQDLRLYDPQIENHIAHTYFMEGNLDEALQIYTRVIGGTANRPNTRGRVSHDSKEAAVVAMTGIGRIHLQRGNLKLAASNFSSALKIDGSYGPALMGLKSLRLEEKAERDLGDSFFTDRESERSSDPSKQSRA